jgi:N-acetyl-beta-hexosaminidase
MSPGLTADRRRQSGAKAGRRRDGLLNRGLLLDVARNFQPENSVLSVLDLMARYKLNALHFHLTDDEGWRLALPSFPELTLVGGRRGHTLDSGDFLPPAFGSGPDVGRPFGSGFYSRTEYMEILQHPDALKIEVIPELCSGHRDSTPSISQPLSPFLSLNVQRPASVRSILLPILGT